MKLLVQIVQSKQAGSAGKHHRPMGKTAKEDFERTVAKSADSENKNTHISIICDRWANNRGII